MSLVHADIYVATHWEIKTEIYPGEGDKDGKFGFKILTRPKEDKRGTRRHYHIMTDSGAHYSTENSASDALNSLLGILNDIQMSEIENGFS